MRGHVVVLIGLLAAACQVSVPPDPPEAAPGARVQEDGIMLRVEQTTYEPGEPVRMTLENRTGHALGVNLCIASLERRQDQQWVDVPDYTDDVCPSLLQVLDSGQQATHEFNLRRDLGPGEYRFRTRIEHMDAGTDDMYPSTTFRIRS